jgi:putative membrane protein
VTSALVIAALVYLRAWTHVRRARPGTVPVWRPLAFLGGLLALWIAVGSPLQSLDDQMLVIHMVKHLLVMAVAAPLLLLGALPLTPLKFLHRPLIGRLARALTHPVVCWLSATLAVVVWHVPAVFELAMRADLWHRVEFTSFLATGLLFWWPVLQPWGTARWSRWSIPVYLFLATLPCDVLSAYLSFCDRVVYASYLDGSQARTASALEDQQLAGALMWVSITFVYLVPAVVITVEILSGPGRRDRALGSTFAAIARGHTEDA